MLTRYICPIQFVVVGSSDYLQRNGYPKTPNELSKHVGINYYYSQFAEEIFFEGVNGRETVKLAVSLRSNNTTMLYQATLASMGLAVLPEWLIADDLINQRLEVLKPYYTLATSSLYAVYTSQR